jgi:hypothetical protein
MRYSGYGIRGGAPVQCDKVKTTAGCFKEKSQYFFSTSAAFFAEMGV